MMTFNGEPIPAPVQRAVAAAQKLAELDPTALEVFADWSEWLADLCKRGESPPWAECQAELERRLKRATA
jgi:hypothetical protein